MAVQGKSEAYKIVSCTRLVADANLWSRAEFSIRCSASYENKDEYWPKLKENLYLEKEKKKR